MVQQWTIKVPSASGATAGTDAVRVWRKQKKRLHRSNNCNIKGKVSAMQQTRTGRKGTRSRRSRDREGQEAADAWTERDREGQESPPPLAWKEGNKMPQPQEGDKTEPVEDSRCWIG